MRKILTAITLAFGLTVAGIGALPAPDTSKAPAPVAAAVDAVVQDAEPAAAAYDEGSTSSGYRAVYCWYSSHTGWMTHWRGVNGRTMNTYGCVPGIRRR